MSKAAEQKILADDSPNFDDLTVVILAGGRSERTGGIDKSTIRVLGKNLS